MVAALRAALRDMLTLQRRHAAPRALPTRTLAGLLPLLAAALAVTAAAYEPPEPGSYELPPIDHIGDHPLLDVTGGRTSLFASKGNRLAVVSFVYRSCGDAEGCPLSMAALHRLDREIAADERLAADVVLLTISFDPARDTPESLRRWREAFAPRSHWTFLTAENDAALAPVLADFGQTVFPLRDQHGDATGLYRHVLKVFLLDRGNDVRNVYGTQFLNPELVLADLRTLLEE